MTADEFYKLVVDQGLTGAEFGSASKRVIGQGHYWHSACLLISNWEFELASIIKTSSPQESRSKCNYLKYQFRNILQLDKGIVDSADKILDQLVKIAVTQTTLGVKDKTASADDYNGKILSASLISRRRTGNRQEKSRNSESDPSSSGSAEPSSHSTNTGVYGLMTVLVIVFGLLCIGVGRRIEESSIRARVRNTLINISLDWASGQDQPIDSFPEDNTIFEDLKEIEKIAKQAISRDSDSGMDKVAEGKRASASNEEPEKQVWKTGKMLSHLEVKEYPFDPKSNSILAPRTEFAVDKSKNIVRRSKEQERVRSEIDSSCRRFADNSQYNSELGDLQIYKLQTVGLKTYFAQTSIHPMARIGCRYQGLDYGLSYKEPVWIEIGKTYSGRDCFEVLYRYDPVESKLTKYRQLHCYTSATVTHIKLIQR